MGRGHKQGAGPARAVSRLRPRSRGGAASEAEPEPPPEAQNCGEGPSWKADAGHGLGTRRRHPEVGVEWVLSECW